MSLCFDTVSMPNEQLLKNYIVILYKGIIQTYFRRSMADKRKSLSKHPYWHRRSRRSTPDLLSPYLLGPELILPSPMSAVQTMPVYSSSRSCSSLNSAPPLELDILHLQIPWHHLSQAWSLQTLVCYTLNLVLLKIFQLGQQQSFSITNGSVWISRAQYFIHSSHSFWSHNSH